MLKRGLSGVRQRLVAEAESRHGARDSMEVGFAPDTLPWLDRPFAGVDDYVSSLDGSAEDGLRERLLHWMQFGYVVLPAAIDHELIDAYLADVEEAFARREHSTNVMIEGYGVRALRECSPEQLAIKHLRVMDFHNASVAGKKLSLHPKIVGFLRHVFREPPVAMQTLTFMHSSEQATHQDFPFVVPTGYPSHLAASWIALEDVHPDSGPLGYYPGSHRLRKFDWGNGLFFDAQSSQDELAFATFLEHEAQKMGLRAETFCPRKGDVFFWHGCLAHMGTTVRDPNRTRRSYVTHYSSMSGYPVDRRARHRKPLQIAYNGGVVYQDPTRPDEEDTFTRGAAF